jgi:5-methylcytosine-specific restriction endonuclease McrA
MRQDYIPATIRRRVAEAARYRCGYCRTQQAVIGIPLHIEHIIPLAAGGTSEENNLWLAQFATTTKVSKLTP